MKVVFLDIDGVLSKYGTKGNAGTNLSKPLMRNLSFLVKTAKAKIVLSSSWRMFPECRFKLDRALRYKGLKIASCTPVIDGGDIKTRQLEIEQWLREHKEVTHYVVLDDIPDYFSKPLSDHLVACDPEAGLTDDKAAAALEILGVFEDESYLLVR